MLALLFPTGVQALSKDLQAYMLGRTYTTIPVQLAGQRGVTQLAAISSVTCSQSFAYEGLEAPVLYLLQYEGGAAFVCFVPGEGGAVSATATFIAPDDALVTAADAAQIQTLLQESIYYTTITVENVELN